MIEKAAKVDLADNQSEMASAMVLFKVDQQDQVTLSLFGSYAADSVMSFEIPGISGAVAKASAGKRQLTITGFDAESMCNKRVSAFVSKNDGNTYYSVFLNKEGLKHVVPQFTEQLSKFAHENNLVPPKKD